ncbi:hypothetical protein QUC31_005110 [Theobroma cacao]|uniref:60S acidic ribosomal protein family n=1 Tax=Theobroma cacao TaxID=3641 RepID=A0A061DU49_THECC|nr:60S acidic ribosomal protein family [Theobroma cacao]
MHYRFLTTEAEFEIRASLSNGPQKSREPNSHFFFKTLFHKAEGKTLEILASERRCTACCEPSVSYFFSQFETMSISELACSYAAMILIDDDISVTADKIAAIIKAANLSVESYWPNLFAKLAEKRNLEDLIANVGAGGGAAAVAVAAPPAGGGGGGAAAPPPAEEKKKEEPEEESDDDMGFSLFD